MSINAVAPLAGAWIEIYQFNKHFLRLSVAPLAGAWIEMAFVDDEQQKAQSLPSRERGLKSLSASGGRDKEVVAPLAGAWIEIRENGH